VWALGLALAGAAAALLGNLVALRQDSLMRMLGYSSIAHSGYLAMALAAGGPLTGQTLLVYLATYAPAVVGALCVAGALGPAGPEGLRGLVRASPLAGAALALALLSMAGLPPTAGFLGKVYLFSALAGAEAWALLAVAALGAALAFVYYLRFTVAACASGEAPPARPLSAAERATLAGALVLMLAPGLYPEPLLALAGAALP
jgi:NADH-quinone oxidoreductase subunit N